LAFPIHVGKLHHKDIVVKRLSSITTRVCGIRHHHATKSRWVGTALSTSGSLVPHWLLKQNVKNEEEQCRKSETLAGLPAFEIRQDWFSKFRSQCSAAVEAVLP